MNKLDMLINELVSLNYRVVNHPEYEELRLNIPNLYGKTVFDTLTSVPDMVIMEYDYLFQAKKYFKDQYKFFTKMPTNDFQDFLSLKKSNPSEVDTIFQDDLSQDELNKFIFCWEDITSFIPDKYKSNIRPNILITKDKLVSHTSFEDNKSQLTISYSSDEKILKSEIIHEYGHLIEQYNQSIKNVSHEFLNKRITYPKKVKLSEFCSRYNLDYLPSAGNIDIYEGSFINPYVGRIYGEMKDNKANTEIISIGLQSFFLDTINFLFKDTEHFAIIYNLLKGNYE